jgi:hypothetical protein
VDEIEDEEADEHKEDAKAGEQTNKHEEDAHIEEVNEAELRSNSIRSNHFHGSAALSIFQCLHCVEAWIFGQMFRPIFQR